MRRDTKVDRYVAIAEDMHGLRHLAQLLVTSDKDDGRFLAVTVSTGCIPSTTKAEGLALYARPFDLPMIQHRDLTLMSYQRKGLATPPATCISCVSMANHFKL